MREELAHPGGRIDYARADALLEQCADRLGASGLSLLLADVADEGTYDAAGLVLLGSPTFGEGLTRAFSYQRLWGDGERFRLRRSTADGGAILTFRHPGPSAVARAVLPELAFVETLRAARTLVAPNVRPEAARFAHEPLGDEADLERALGVAPSFGSRENELVLPRALFDAPLRLPDGTLGRIFDALARQAMSALPQSLSLEARLRAICDRAPQNLALSVVQMAERVHMSPRTPQRRLQASGTSWKRVVDDLRRAKAEQLEARGASAKEVTFLLGFSDPSALARARARWVRG